MLEISCGEKEWQETDVNYNFSNDPIFLACAMYLTLSIAVFDMNVPTMLQLTLVSWREL